MRLRAPYRVGKAFLPPAGLAVPKNLRKPAGANRNMRGWQ